jgi:hypothetical protein
MPAYQCCFLDERGNPVRVASLQSSNDHDAHWEAMELVIRTGLFAGSRLRQSSRSGGSSMGMMPTMRSFFVVLAVGCASLASEAVSQTFPSTSLQAFPAPFRVPQPADINPNPASRMTVSSEETELRVSPNANATALETFSFGTKVTALGTTGGWSHVDIGGRDGYISSQSLKLVSRTRRRSWYCRRRASRYLWPLSCDKRSIREAHHHNTAEV